MESSAMAFDQTSIPKDLRSINVARTVAEEPRIQAVVTTAGFFPNPAHEAGSTGSIPVFYPATVSDAGFVVPGHGTQVPGVAAWCPRPPAPVGPVGVNPVGGFVYSPNLGGRVVSDAMDQTGAEMAAGFGQSQGLGSRDNGNGGDRLSTDAMNRKFYNMSSGTRSSGNGADVRSEEGGDDSVSGKKVKFLCSFGGKILPRPSDGMLRYVGGQTRIVSVRRDVSFHDLGQKMTETYGQPMVIKYQLPDEDLDALVSVSCPDDLENMMEEYEKLLERSSDGSAKLRVFLFSASEFDPSGVVPFGDIQDSGQRYVEAVNGVTDGFAGGITRKESIASASSTQNSDFSGTDAVESSGPSQVDFGVSPSMSQLSPREDLAASHETAPRIVPADPSPTAYAMPMAIPPVSEKPVPLHIEQQQMGHELQNPGIISSGHHSQAYIDPHIEVSKHPDYRSPPSMGFPSPHLLGNVGSVFTRPQFHDGPMSVSSHHLFPAVHMTMTPTSPHLGVRPVVIQPLMQNHETRLEHYPDKTTLGARVVQLPVDQSYNATYQDQIAPAVVGGGYGWHQGAPPDRVVFSDGALPPQQVIFPEKLQRLEDCHMCQRALPHAHSDPVVQEKKDVVGNPVPDSSPVYHSFHPDDAMRIRQLNKFMGTGAMMRSEQGPGAQPRVIAHVDHQVGAPRSEGVGLSHNLETQYEQDRNALPKDIAFAAQLQASEPLSHETLKEHPIKISAAVQKENNVDASVSYDHLTQVGRMMENLHVCSPEIYANSGKSMPPTEKAWKEEILDNTPPQIAGRDMFLGINFSQAPVLLDSNHIKPTEILSKTRVEIPHMINCQPIEPSGLAQSPFLGNPGLPQQSAVENQHLNSVKTHYGNPAYSAVESKYAADRVPLPNLNIPPALSPCTGAGDVQDASNSLFSNQDPWNLQHDNHPPRPKKIQMKKEAFGIQNHLGENLNVMSGVSSPEKQLEDGILQTLCDSNKDFNPEHSRSAKGLEEEQIKQDLQNVAEGVAASVFQSNTPSNHELPPLLDESAFDTSRKGEVSHSGLETQHTSPVEDIRTKLPDRLNFGFPVNVHIGRLQIIKDGDLEELRELGSGTFGTVYHGKWRGTDVAIKRINDRCFAGKPSEQERMIDDFWNEASKLADLHHPNVVAFYGIVLDSPGGAIATVTEYMVNGSLRNALQKNVRNLDKRKRLLIALDVAFGMEYLHGKNIVHFDLKSDNLLVNLRDPHRPICKVGDLGLSKVKCQTLISGGVRGTLPWMAPELLNGSSSLVSEKVDVFSFGIVMWELLTGEEPYADLHYGAIIGGIVSNTLRPPIPELCDPDWKSLMERCWAAEPSDRPSFTEIANELRSIATKLPSKGQAPSQPQQ